MDLLFHVLVDGILLMTATRIFFLFSSLFSCCHVFDLIFVIKQPAKSTRNGYPVKKVKDQSENACSRSVIFDTRRQGSSHLLYYSSLS